MRGQLELSKRDQEAVTFAVDAMLELAEESPFPPDWRMVEKMRRFNFGASPAPFTIADVRMSVIEPP